MLVLGAAVCVKSPPEKQESSQPGPQVRLERAVVLATADETDPGMISDGALLAYEALNRHGLPTVLRDRSLLTSSRILNKFKLLIASTLYGYHDADRRFSLTYMDDDQLQELSRWISSGGILVAGENIGRNTRGGHDRILDSGRLQAGSWVFGEVIGMTLVERDLNGYELEVDTTGFMQNLWESLHKARLEEPAWMLVPEGPFPAQGLIPLAWWTKESTRIPAAWARRLNLGWIIYFTDFRLLHPMVDGGLSTPEEIDRFYALMVQLASGAGPAQAEERFAVVVEPWPEGRPAALALTLNCDGNETNLMEVIKQLEDEAGRLTVFAHRLDMLAATFSVNQLTHVELASSSSKILPLTNLDPGEAREAIPWTQGGDPPYLGFRFPRLALNAPLLHCLEERGYTYDSSLPVNHQEYFGASLFPFELPLRKSEAGLLGINILEMGPIDRDDWSFYGDTTGDPDQQAALYDHFLQSYWQQVFLTNHGLMIQVGDIDYEGNSPDRLAPILRLIRQARSDGAWITDLASAAKFWTLRRQAEVSLWFEGNSAHGRITADGSDLSGLTYKLIPPRGQEIRDLKMTPTGVVIRGKDRTWSLICGSGTEINFEVVLR
jgi:hypothetical protein